MERVKKTLHLPLDIVKEIQQYQKEHYFSTFTAAVIALIQKGLQS